MRHCTGGRRAQPDDESQVVRAAAVDPRIIIEDKGSSLAVHYRLAPAQAHLDERQDRRDRSIARRAEKLEMLCGKSVIEIKPRLSTRALAVRELMQKPPFAARATGVRRRRRHRRVGVRDAARVRRLGYSVGREVAGVRRRVRWSAGRPRLARRPRRRTWLTRHARFRARSCDHRQRPHGRAGRPLSRIVWWCYPRFDGDPVFSGCWPATKEKGFCDVVLDGMVEHSSRYVRNTAIVSHDPDRRQRRIGPDHRFRAAVLANTTGPSARLSSCGSSSRFPGCRASRSGCGRPRLRRADDGASIGSNHVTLSRQRTSSSASPPTLRCPTSTAKHRSC